MDKARFEDWLKGRPREHAVLVAARIAARTFPCLSLLSSHPQKNGEVLLSISRAILTAYIPLTDDFLTVAAANAAADAVNQSFNLEPFVASLAGTTAASAAYSAANKDTYAEDTGKALLSAIDAYQALETLDGSSQEDRYFGTTIAFVIALGKDEALPFSKLSETPLWDDDSIPDFLSFDYTEREVFGASGDFWDFWKRWYEGLFSGEHLSWDLQRRVALIEEDIWQAGPKAVAEEIARIEAEFRTAISVPLIRNEADTAFVLDDEPHLDDELLDYIKERVGGALRTALDGISDNIFNKDSPEALAISEALRSKNPSAVAGHLNDASLFFQKNLGNPYPSDEDVLIALQEVAFSAAEEICETNELARKRCLKATRLFQKEHLKPIDAQEMKEFTYEIAKEAEGEAKTIIQRIGEAIAAGKQVGRFARARFANYSSKIVSWIDKTKKGEARVSWLWKKVRELMDVFEPPSEG